MDISIIIPVYNSQNYLERCLDSVIRALKYYKKTGEILMVDNNSTDNSLEIIKSYQKKYPKIIRILKCKVQGAAATRNYGTSNAKGKYIWYVDADDEITEESIKELLDVALETQADLVMLGIKRVYPDHHSDYLSAVCPNQVNYKSRFVRYGMGPMQLLIRKKWWDENGFKFREGIIHEDMELMSALILYTDKYAAVDKPLYFYYQNEGSVLHKKQWDPHYFDIFVALDGLYDRFKKAGAEKAYRDELEWFFIWNLLIDSAKDFQKFPEGKSGFYQSREMLKKYFPNWRKNRFLKEKPLKLRARVLFNYFLTLTKDGANNKGC